LPQIATALKEKYMNRNIASALAIGSAAVVAAAIVAVTPGNALAESIVEYTMPFASNRSRADVQADLVRQGNTARTGSNEWLMQDNQVTPFKSSYASGQAKAEFKADRREGAALTGEDSGSAYLAGTAVPLRANPRATMGGPAR
jgi:hypothetical protein